MKILLVLASFGMMVTAQYPDALGAPGTSYGAPAAARPAAEFQISSTVPFQGGYPAPSAPRGPAEYLPPVSSPVLFAMPVVQREEQYSSSPSGGYPGSGSRAPAAGGYPGAGSGGYPASGGPRVPAGGYSQAQSSPQYSAPAQYPAAPAQYSAPSPQYGSPAAPSAQYNAQSSPQYSAPAPSSQYGAPQSGANGASQYGPPAQSGGPRGQGYPPESETQISGGAGADDRKGGAVQKVHKHVYVHVAPDEEPEPKEEKSPKAPLIPEKHYKILFIKAPTPPPYEAPEIPEAQPAPETKTLVYVLLKKPEPTPALQLAEAPPTKPSKPEVYFIRYKSPEGQAKSSPEAGFPDGQGGAGDNGGANNGLDDGRAQGGYSNSGAAGGPREYGVPN